MGRQRKYATVEEAKEANRQRSLKRWKEMKSDEWKSQRFMQRKLDLVGPYKQKGCSKCGEKELCVLDFHHLDPTQKEF